MEYEDDIDYEDNTEYENLYFCWDVIADGEYYDQEQDIQISFGKVSLVSKGGWYISHDRYSDIYKIEYCKKTICIINYEYKEYTWYKCNEEATTLSKMEILKLFEAYNFEEVEE